MCYNNKEYKKGDIMPKRQKTILNAILFVILIVITFFWIFKDYSLTMTINAMLKTKLIYLVLALFSMFLYFFFETINVREIIKSLGHRIKLFKAYKFTLINFFFSGITPGGGGGQPMEIYYMSKEGIPVAKSTIALILTLGSYHVITIILGLIGLFMNYELLTKRFIWIFILGLSLKLLVLCGLLILLFSKKLSQAFINLIIKVLKLFKYSKITEFNDKANKILETYNQGATYLKEHQLIMLKSLLIATIQVIFYYSVTYFVYLSFGLHEYNYLKIISIQALLLVSTSSIPLPGAVGISEHAFLTINETMFKMAFLPSALILSRGITFYIVMLLALIIIIANTIYLKRKNK